MISSHILVQVHVCVCGLFKATCSLLLACLLLPLLLLNAINCLVEVKHCGGGKEDTHTLTHLRESRTLTSARAHISSCIHSNFHT